jgi:hypothetical protein
MLSTWKIPVFGSTTIGCQAAAEAFTAAQSGEMQGEAEDSKWFLRVSRKTMFNGVTRRAATGRDTQLLKDRLDMRIHGSRADH